MTTAGPSLEGDGWSRRLGENAPDQSVLSSLDWRGFFLTVIVVILCVLLFGMAGGASGIAQANETTDSTDTSDTEETETPPVLERGDKIDTTTIQLLISDDDGVNLSSITASEFFLSDGELADIAVQANGTDADVRLQLAEPVGVDEIHIGVASTTTIQNSHGLTLDVETRDTVTVSGMDGIPPEIVVIDVPQITSNETAISYAFDEELRDISVALTGPVDRQLTMDDFEHVSGYRYSGTLDLPTDGEYTVELVNATDQAGNTATYGIESEMEVKTASPRTVATVDQEASDGFELIFDANRSDPTIEEYHWNFGDGTTASGERVSHEFQPGVYEVVLRGTDSVGNVGEDRLILNVTGGIDAVQIGPAQWPESPVVDVVLPWPGISPDTRVMVSGAIANQPLFIGASPAGVSLLETDSIDLHSLTPTVTQNTSYRLGLLTTADSTVAGAEVAPVETVVDGFEVRPSIDSSLVSNVTFEFSVAESVFNETELEPSDVTLLRNASGWGQLPTNLVGDSADAYRFSAESPGFSTFAIGLERGIDENDDGVNESDANSEAVNGDEVNGEDESEEDENEEDENEGDENGENEDDEIENGEDENDTGDATTDGEEGDGEDGDQQNGPGVDEDGTETEEEDDERAALFGIIPYWLLLALIQYVAIPLIILYTGLKSVAFHLGY